MAGLGKENEYELPMTQEQIADCTGLTPEHVNRALKRLEADNLITRQTTAQSASGTGASWPCRRFRQ